MGRGRRHITPLISNIPKVRRAFTSVNNLRSDEIEALQRRPRHVALIKHRMRRNDRLLGGRVVEQPRLGARRVPQEDALLRVRLERAPVLVLHQDIGQAAKDAEVADIRRLAGPGDVGGGVARQSGGRSAVGDVVVGGYSVGPERRRQLRLVEHGAGAISKGQISTLCNAVLMRLIWLCDLQPPPLLQRRVLHDVGDVLAAPIAAQYLQALAALHLGSRLELLDRSPSVALALQIRHPAPPRLVVYEGDPVEVRPLSGCDRHRTLQVGVNQLEGTRSALSRTARYRLARLLAHDAGLADRVRRLLALKPHAPHQLALPQLRDVPMVDVRKAAVPERSVERERGRGGALRAVRRRNDDIAVQIARVRVVHCSGADERPSAVEGDALVLDADLVPLVRSEVVDG